MDGMKHQTMLRHSSFCASSLTNNLCHQQFQLVFTLFTNYKTRNLLAYRYSWSGKTTKQNLSLSKLSRSFSFSLMFAFVSFPLSFFEQLSCCFLLGIPHLKKHPVRWDQATCLETGLHNEKFADMHGTKNRSLKTGNMLNKIMQNCTDTSPLTFYISYWLLNPPAVMLHIMISQTKVGGLTNNMHTLAAS